MAVISPWDIYWVLQLDSISSCVGFFAVVGGIGAVMAMVVGALVTDRGDFPTPEQDDAWRRVKILSARLTVFAAILGLASAFIPSTRTAAAMIVIPKVANSETIQREAGDLYQLAKDALRKAVKPQDGEDRK